MDCSLTPFLVLKIQAFQKLIRVFKGVVEEEEATHDYERWKTSRCKIFRNEETTTLSNLST
jgi:hypothetical protein